MPTPQKGEKLGEFVGQWIKSKEAKRKFPKRSQRIAIAENEGRKAHLKK